MKTKKNNATFKVISLMLVMVMMLGILVQAFAADNKYVTPTFTDVPKSHWAYTFVEQAAEKGWVSGVGDGKFMPDGQVTYAQLVTMLGQAFFKSDVDSYTGVTNPWYAKFCNVANQNGLFKGTNAQNHVLDERYVGVAVNRYEMAQMLYNAMKAKGLNVTADQNAAKASTADWNSIPYKYRDAVAVCKAAGVINGTDSNGTFGGNGLMTRAQACVVLIQLDKYIANGGSSGNQGGQGNQPQDPNANYGPVGTMSDFKVTLSLDTHKPIHDYWSQQSADVKALIGKDIFNCVVQSMKDSEMIMTQGEFGTGRRGKSRNLYYNYAVYEDDMTSQSLIAQAGLWMSGPGYPVGVGTTYVDNGAQPTLRIGSLNRHPDADQLSTIFAPIFARFPANATDKQKVDICVQEIVNRFDYETGTPGAGFNWLNGDTKGNCENYTRTASQILAAAGIPNFQLGGMVSNGAHAWLQAYVDGKWCIVDATAAEYGYSATMTFSEHEKLYGYSHASNEADETKVARALVEASLA